MYELLAAAIEYQLSQPPAHAGMRLKTVRELARMVGVSHEWMNKSLGGLVERGILVRKHGSGVYVRKVPPADGRTLDPKWEKKLQNIFANDPVVTRKRPEPTTACFNLDLWWDDIPLGVSGRLLQNGIRDQIRELGHRLRSHVLRGNGRDSLLKEKSVMKSDGHIVWSPVADDFEQRVESAGQLKAYLWCSNVVTPLQPIVEIDMAEALTRAVRLLADEGYERIALLDHAENADRHQPLYESCLQQAGRVYRAAEFCDPHAAGDVAAVRRLFTRPDAPQAVYVADDVVLRHALPVMRDLGFEPGRNLGLITSSNRGSMLPGGLKWSRMEFDLYAVGRLAAQSLLREIESAGDELLSFAHRAAWKPGNTHRLTAS